MWIEETMATKGLTIKMSYIKKEKVFCVNSSVEKKKAGKMLPEFKFQQLSLEMPNLFLGT